MEHAKSIEYLTRPQINDAKWDHCIAQAPNGVIYAYSYFLDTMSKNWDALVVNDYEFIMPLTWNKKMGIYYLYQPFLTPVGGVFGPSISRDVVLRFIQAIPKKFKYVDISLNAKNEVTETFHLEKRMNFILPLDVPYHDLQKNYSQNTKRNIRKALEAECTTKTNIGIEKIIELAVLQMQYYGPTTKENIEKFRKLFAKLEQKNMTQTYGVLSSDNQLLSACVFFFSHNRAYYILVGNNPQSRFVGASHLLIDSFIKLNASKDLRLDFEGSDIPGLANFYSGFGAQAEPYQSIKINRLPYFLKWLKK